MVLVKKFKWLWSILSICVVMLSKPYCILKASSTIYENNVLLPYSIDEVVSYKVKFNGINVGRIKFEYKGCKEIDGLYQHIIILKSNVKILKLFQIESQEKIFIDKDSYLPLKVEREVGFLGKEELIQEKYNQKEGKVEIMKKGIPEGKLIYQNPPIHSSISLFFLYPLNLQNNLGKTLEFNLPLEKISIKIKELRKSASSEGIKEFYILEGLPRKFLIWIEKDKRIPFRIQLPAFLGRVTIFLDQKVRKYDI